jgi:hypothetical protein
MVIEAGVQYMPGDEVSQRVYYFQISGRNLQEIIRRMNKLKGELDAYLENNPANSSIRLAFDNTDQSKNA